MSDRPKLTLPRSAYEWALDVVAILLVVGSIAYVLLEVPGMEGPVPVHFDVTGEPDRWGSLDHVWWILALTVFQYGLLTALERVPHVFNYPPWVSITAGNAARHYRLARTFVVEMKTLIVATFAVVLVSIVVMAKGGPAVVHGIWPLIGLLFIDVGWYLVRSRRVEG